MTSRILTPAALAAAFFSTAALAGQCPADRKVDDNSGQPMSATAAKDVTDVVVASTDLAKERAAINDRLLRARKLEIQPGGIVPWHSHDDRPAMIYIVKGTVTEYASSCKDPIVHREGDIAPERFGTSHWWKNTGEQTAVLISVDLFKKT